MLRTSVFLFFSVCSRNRATPSTPSSLSPSLLLPFPRAAEPQLGGPRWKHGRASGRASGGEQAGRAHQRAGREMAQIRLPVSAFLLLAVVEAAAATCSPSAYVQNAIYSNRIAIFPKTYCPGFKLKVYWMNKMRKPVVRHPASTQKLRNLKLYYATKKMRICPGGAVIDVPVIDSSSASTGETNQPNGKSTPTAASAIPDKDLAEIIRVIRSCRDGINKLVESLQQRFPSVSRSQPKSKMREISDFVDNHWQVKKEVLDKLGLNYSPGTQLDILLSVVQFYLFKHLSFQLLYTQLLFGFLYVLC